MHSCRTSLPGVARSHPSVRATPTSRRGSSASATSGLGLWGAVTGLVGSLARGTSARTMAYAEGPKWWDSSSVAVVTGANKGIGLEISKALRTQGMTVVMTARNEQMGNDAKGKVEALEGVSRVLAEVAGGDTTGEMFAAFSRGHDGLLLLQEQSLMDIDIGKNVMAIPKNGALCCWGLAVRRADIVQPSTPCEPLVSMLLCSTRLLSRFHVRCNPSLP